MRLCLWHQRLQLSSKQPPALPPPPNPPSPALHVRSLFPTVTWFFALMYCNGNALMPFLFYKRLKNAPPQPQFSHLSQNPFTQFSSYLTQFLSHLTQFSLSWKDPRANLPKCTNKLFRRINQNVVSQFCHVKIVVGGKHHILCDILHNKSWFQQFKSLRSKTSGKENHVGQIPGHLLWGKVKKD